MKKIVLSMVVLCALIGSAHATTLQDVGACKTLSASIFDVNNNESVPPGASWAVSPTTVGTIEPNGPGATAVFCCVRSGIAVVTTRADNGSNGILSFPSRFQCVYHGPQANILTVRVLP